MVTQKYCRQLFDFSEEIDTYEQSPRLRYILWVIIVIFWNRVYMGLLKGSKFA